MPKVSVIIPVYNVEKYLAECLDSVINQTYKDIEIICINDGSPDNSPKILKDYAKKDERIKIINQENQGVSVARNNGINNATGEYICFIDSDDTIEDKYIEKLCKCIVIEDYDLVVMSDYEWYQRPLINLGLLPTWAIAVKKQFLDNYPDIRFPTGIMPCEDGIFSHKILTLTNKVGRCKEAKYFYRQRQNSSEHTLSAKLIEEQIPKWLDIIEKHYNKYDLWGKNEHLLTFLMIEPYYRLKSIDFTSKQTRKLINIILNFVHKYNINEYYNKQLYPADFIDFINSKNYTQYHKLKLLQFIQNILSVRNSHDGKHKIITILGIKLKFKRKKKND